MIKVAASVRLATERNFPNFPLRSEGDLHPPAHQLMGGQCETVAGKVGAGKGG